MTTETLEVWTPPSHPNYAKNRDNCSGDDMPCFICGKPVTVPKYWARITLGLSICTDEYAERDPSADTGFYPIGPECYRKLTPEVKALVSVPK